MNELIQMIKNGISPKQMVMTMAKKNNNPIIQNLVSNVEKGDTKSVETFARNFFKEQGRDFDKEFSNFMKNFK